MTQAARALGLQRRFDDAAALLDGIEAAGSDDRELGARILLERGRVLNSRGSPDAARSVFESAHSLASSEGFEHLAIDALHMRATVAPPDDRAALNEQALEMSSKASDPRARDWRASLLNNLGWTRFDAGEYEVALWLFEEALEERTRQGKAREIGIARWSVGRTLRALGRVEEALAVQQDLVLWLGAAELTDSYVEEEFGECLVALGRADEAGGHFAAAAQLLDAGGPGEQADPERLARLRDRAATPEPGSG